MTKPDIIPGRTIYVVGSSTSYANWCQARIANTIEEASLIMFTGGEDISAHLYGKSPHPTTWSNAVRDREEVSAFKHALKLNKPMIGTCRGAQLLSALSGAILVQDQANPYSRHPIITHDGKTIIATSSHHQAQFPWGLPADEFKILGWTVGLSPYHYGESDDEELVIGAAPDNREVEMCYYPKTRALCLQQHTEWSYSDYERDNAARESVDYCRDLLTKLIAGTL